MSDISWISPMRQPPIYSEDLGIDIGQVMRMERSNQTPQGFRTHLEEPGRFGDVHASVSWQGNQIVYQGDVLPLLGALTVLLGLFEKG